SSSGAIRIKHSLRKSRNWRGAPPTVHPIARHSPQSRLSLRSGSKPPRNWGDSSLNTTVAERGPLDGLRWGPPPSAFGHLLPGGGEGDGARGAPVALAPTGRGSG